MEDRSERLTLRKITFFLIFLAKILMFLAIGILTCLLIIGGIQGFVLLLIKAFGGVIKGGISSKELYYYGTSLSVWLGVALYYAWREFSHNYTYP